MNGLNVFSRIQIILILQSWHFTLFSMEVLQYFFPGVYIVNRCTDFPTMGPLLVVNFDCPFGICYTVFYNRKVSIPYVEF